ncbi:hypothetical protein JCM10908_006883 [Rhodotorula pacifica]|uniref:uncharacterized protein n=1 Tax=Rhodotorula pacifica TaxID=1495444 RepID=UPI00317AC7A0
MSSKGQVRSSRVLRAIQDEERSDVGLPKATWLLLVVLFLAAAALALLLASGKAAPTADGQAAVPATSPSASSGEFSEGTSSATRSQKSPAATVTTGFLASLAAKHSMSPAIVSSLPMPTAEAKTAGSYIASDWHALKGTDQKELSFVKDPLDSSGAIVLQMAYPKGSYSGSDTGGVGNMQLAVYGQGKNRAILSYEVGFNKDFDFVKGGKLPGLYGGDTNAHCTGGKNDQSCFSLRLMWRQKGAGEIYAYMPTYPKFCSDGPGTDKIYCHSDGFGASIHRGAFTFKSGVWNQVTQVVVLNSKPDLANGYLALYAGEELAIELTDVVFRVNTSVTATAMTFSTFFGGSSADYAATNDCWSYYRNFRFFSGDEASAADGATVQASYGD